MIVTKFAPAIKRIWANQLSPIPPEIIMWFIWFIDLYWLDDFLLSDIISNFISLLNYKYRFMSFNFYIAWKNLIWRLPTYLLLKLHKLLLLGKFLKWNCFFFFFFQKEYSLQKYWTKSIFFFAFIIWFTDMHQLRCIKCDNTKIL